MLGANMLSMSTLSLYRNGVQFAMSIAITAFITPAEYGLVVFTLPFVTLIAMMTDLGLSSAITRSDAVSVEDAGAALTLMIAVGAGLALTMAIGAAPLQHVLAMPGLGPIMAAMAVVVLLTVTATTPRALLERRLRYGVIAGVEAAAVLVAVVFALAAAWRGAGVWALVLYNIVNHSLRVTTFLWLSRRDLKLNLDWRSLGPLLSFGGWVLASNLLNFLARNSDNLLIGAWLGAAAVGIYGLAYQFMLAPLMAITWPTSGILLATLRREALGEKRAQQMIEGVMAATAMLTFPVMAFVSFGLAFPAAAMLSPRWHEVPTIVAYLAPLGALQSIASYNGAVLLVAGRARMQFLFTVVNTLALLATFVGSLSFGLLVLVKAYVVVSTLLNLMFLALIVALTSLTWRGLLVALAPALAATAMGLAITAAAAGLHAASWPQWLVSVTLFGAGVAGTYLLLGRRVRASLGILVARTA